MNAQGTVRAQEKLRALVFVEMGLREDADALKLLAQEPITGDLVKHLVGIGVMLADRAYGPTAAAIVAEWRQQAAAELAELEQP